MRINAQTPPFAMKTYLEKGKYSNRMLKKQDLQFSHNDSKRPKYQKTTDRIFG